MALRFDILVVGSGLAGQSAALRLAQTHSVGLISKRTLQDSASSWAQGGIAAVLDSQDSLEDHIRDTLVAGAFLNDEKATRFVIENGRRMIEWLAEQGVPFTRDDAGYHLTREGGHSARRVIHVADATGLAVQDTLTRKVREHPNITVLEHHIAIDLITGNKLGQSENRCYGAYVLDTLNDEVVTLAAQHTLIATGGAGKVYLYTTNPDTSTGDGIAMAWRAGCSVANMEFIQFHPTCLYHPQERSFLITEALRGEGAHLKLPLKDADGNITAVRFMPEHDPRAELAPRDIVARAIDFEIKKHGLDHVLLDATHLGRAFLQEHFPTIYQRCMELGIDIATTPIPVVPAAHYTCGGVVTDLHGQTDLPRLYTVGEASYTGLHGANRLASNSLLECVVFGKSCAASILQQPPAPCPALPEWDESMVENADEQVVIAHNWDEVRLMMWNYVGIVRTVRRLERAQNRIVLLKEEINDYYANFKVSRDLLELRNLLDCADLIVRSALSRHESRGLHYIRDYPNPLPASFPTILFKKSTKKVGKKGQRKSK